VYDEVSKQQQQQHQQQQQQQGRALRRAGLSRRSCTSRCRMSGCDCVVVGASNCCCRAGWGMGLRSQLRICLQLRSLQLRKHAGLNQVVPAALGIADSCLSVSLHLQVAVLFRQHADLLTEFTYFLPDNSPPQVHRATAGPALAAAAARRAAVAAAMQGWGSSSRCSSSCSKGLLSRVLRTATGSYE
jgi:hypothetical protein